MNKTVLFAIIGAVLGVPLSYYFQPAIIQSKLTLGQYLSNLPQILGDKSADFVTPVLLSCVICTLVLGIVGYFMDRSNA
jgi:hypothetical protein